MIILILIWKTRKMFLSKNLMWKTSKKNVMWKKMSSTNSRLWDRVVVFLNERADQEFAWTGKLIPSGLLRSTFAEETKKKIVSLQFVKNVQKTKKICIWNQFCMFQKGSLQKNWKFIRLKFFKKKCRWGKNMNRRCRASAIFVKALFSVSCDLQLSQSVFHLWINVSFEHPHWFRKGCKKCRCCVHSKFPSENEKH